MIIRTSLRREYSSLPNKMLRDNRLSLDTKGLLAFLNSLPPNWQIRHAWLAKQLSPKDGRQVGLERLRRMFDEARAAGYMARSREQSHEDDGRWGSFVYVIGTDPELVKQEVATQSASVAFLPHTAEPHTAEPHTANPQRYKRKRDRKYPKIETETSESSYGDAAIAATAKGQPN